MCIRDRQPRVVDEDLLGLLELLHHVAAVALPAGAGQQLGRDLLRLVGRAERVLLADEGGDEVVRVREVGEPAAPEHRVLTLLVALDIGLPGAALEGDVEQLRRLQLPLDLLELQRGLGPVAVRGVPEGERDPLGDARVGEDLPGLVDTGLAVVVEEAGGVPGEALGDHGVQRVDGVLVDLVRDRRAVHDLGDGLTHLPLAGPRVLGVEHQVVDVGPAALDELDLLFLGGPALELDDVARGQAAVGQVDPVGAQLLDHGAGILEVADGHRVVAAVGVALVPLVAHQFGLLALVVRLQGVGARTDDAAVLPQGVGRVGVRVDDRHGGGGEHEGEGGVRLVEVEDDLALAGCLHPFEAAEEARGTAVDVDRADPVDGVLDRLGVERAAVGELQALAQFAAEHAVGVVGELAVLGGVRLGRAGADRVAQQGLVDVAEQLPRAVPGGGGVQRARRTRGAHDYGPFVVRAVGRQDAASGHQGRYGRDGRRPPQASVPVEHAHAPRSAMPRVGRPYRSVTPADPPVYSA